MEEMGEMIGKGFGVWRSNLNLCIPFLLSAFVTTLLALPFLAAFFMTLLPLDRMDVDISAAKSVSRHLEFYPFTRIIGICRDFPGFLGSTSRGNQFQSVCYREDLDIH